MVEQEIGLRCLKCGYALRGLPARKCDDCGHVYLRCPECGTSQIANESQNRLLLQMRAKATRLPGRIQGAQITFLVMLGVAWVVAGFGGGEAAPEMSVTGHFVFAGIATVAACLVRLLVFQLKSPWVAMVSAMAFLMITFSLGLLCAWGNAHVPIANLLVLAAWVAAGAAIGGRGAEVVGWVILWIFAKDEDRVVLAGAYQGVLNGRLRNDDSATPTRQLMYCTHCAAELPALISVTCADCGLQQVTCPTCGKRCGVSSALAAMLEVARLTRGVSAGVWVLVRAVMAAIMWMWMVAALLDAVVPGVTRWGRSARIAAQISVAPRGVVYLLIPVALLTWLVFKRGAVSRALLCAGMVLTAIWFVVENGPRSVEVPPLLVVILAIGAGAVSLSASSVAAVIQAWLPRRRVAVLEDVVPELARDPAPSPAGTRTGT